MGKTSKMDLVMLLGYNRALSKDLLVVDQRHALAEVTYICDRAR